VGGVSCSCGSDVPAGSTVPTTQAKAAQDKVQADAPNSVKASHGGGLAGPPPAAKPGEKVGPPEAGNKSGTG
jgi:hypothetical protein